MAQHYVYLIECRDQSIYTGYTTNLKRRMHEHATGDPKSAKYVKSRGFSRLLYSEIHESKSSAMQREHEIKQLRRADKFNLINSLNKFQ